MEKKILSNGSVVVWRQVKRENSSLPVAVRVSKTHVLKFPIDDDDNLWPWQRLWQGSRGGAVVIALACHQCVPGLIPYVGWVCWFSTLLRGVFIRVLRFSALHKNQLMVCIWRHGGHVGVQNNAVKCLLGIWLYYYAKTCGAIFYCSVH